MPKASVAIQILPKVKNKEKLLKIIDEVISFIKKQGVTCEVGPMETTMEGELDQLLEIVKIIYSPKGVMTIREKVAKHR